MKILSPFSLKTSRRTQTECAISSPVFVIVAVVSRQVSPHCEGVPESSVNSTGLFAGDGVGLGVGVRVVAMLVGGIVVAEVMGAVSCGVVVALVVMVRMGVGLGGAVSCSPERSGFSSPGGTVSWRKKKLPRMKIIATTMKSTAVLSFFMHAIWAFRENEDSLCTTSSRWCDPPCAGGLEDR